MTRLNTALNCFIYWGTGLWFTANLFDVVPTPDKVLSSSRRRVRFHNTRCVFALLLMRPESAQIRRETTTLGREQNLTNSRHRTSKPEPKDPKYNWRLLSDLIRNNTVKTKTHIFWWWINSLKTQLKKISQLNSKRIMFESFETEL